MGKYASKIVELAQSWIGKKESDGSHKTIIDIYNGHTPRARGYKVKYTDAWCATTISALAIKLGYTDIIPTECGCGQMIELFKKIGSWVENDAYTPKAGDIIFYDWQDSGKGDNTGWSDHVGVVEKVSNGIITIIEGNKNDGVERRTIAVNGKTIRGYGTPKYDTEPKPQPTKIKTLDDWAKEVIAGKHGTGHANREASLKKAGCTFAYSEVRAKVNVLCGAKTTTTPKPSAYYPKYTGNSYGIDTVFKAIGVSESMRGNWKNRRTIASANGISNYKGTASQNTRLIQLAIQGKLKKV